MAKKVRQVRRRKRCEVCDKLKPDARKRPDPYQADVNNREVSRVLCNDCTHELAMDI